MACRSGCADQDCPNYSACLRKANVQSLYAQPSKGLDMSREKKWRRELSDYRDARKQGIEPDGTSRQAIDRAVRISDQTGQAYRAPGMEAA